MKVSMMVVVVVVVAYSMLAVFAFTLRQLPKLDA